MSFPAKRRATYDDLIALPENVVGELIGGEVIASPRPAGRHARATVKLTSALGPPFDSGDGGPGGWWFLFEPELHFGDDVLVPDLAGWRRERKPPDPGAAFFTLAPDWVCEVLSPSTARVDRMRKLPRDAAVGVGHVWLVDPLATTLEVYRNDGAGHVVLVQTAEGEVAVRAEPFEAVALSLAALWE